MKKPAIFRIFEQDQPKLTSSSKTEERNMTEKERPSFKPKEELVCPKGLSNKEAQKRLKQDGENRLKSEKQVSAAKIFAGQFKDFLVLILLVSTGISVFMGEFAEALSIAVILLLNAILGFIQEYRTEKTLETLKNMAAPTSKVFRDGTLREIPAVELVTGDLIEVQAGDRVPADAVLCSASHLEAEESILTGESVPAVKTPDPSKGTSNDLNQPHLLYMGTSIVKGHGRATIVATGMNTQMGRIAGMLGEIQEEPTPLQKRLDELGKYIVAACLFISAIVIAVGLFRGYPLLQMLITGVSLAVAAVPEGLPAIVTIALALAVKRMVRRHALVRRLHAVETLGCASIICTDKTGTLTENKMTVREVVTANANYRVEGNGYQQAGGFLRDGNHIHAKYETTLCRLLETAVLCNNAKISVPNQEVRRDRTRSTASGLYRTIGEPTEIALLVMAAKGGVTRQSLQSEYQVYDETPFDSAVKYMSVSTRTPGGREYYFFKGAYDVISKQCDRCMTEQGTRPFSEMNGYFDEKNKQLASSGMRVLAFAYREGGQGDSHLVFLGLCGMIDPPRKEARRAVQVCRRAGVRTVMITGDHQLTACAIGEQVGIYRKGNLCFTGAELDAMSDSALEKVIHQATVFARVSPSHKLRIVRALKRRGEIVAMTGDGVNDAPAIKEADIGVSMGITGSDVTKQAADVILLDDNFATMVAAIEEGRVIYGNIRKFIRYLLSCNIGEVVTMFLGMLMGMPVPLLPMQILMVNLVTDGLPAIALGLDPAEEDTMKKPPRSANDSIFSGGLVFTILTRGILIGFTTLTVFTIVFRMSLSVDAARTAAFLALVLSQLIHVFECKSETKSIFKIPYGNNKMLLFSALISAIVAIASIYLQPLNQLLKTCPLPQAQFLITVACTLIIPVLNAFILKFKRMKSEKSALMIPSVDKS